MAEKSVIRTNFSGGITTIGEKIGSENSFAFAKNLNIFESPDYVTQSRKTTKVSGATVTDLVLFSADGSPWNTNRYFADLAGKIYQETSGGVWSNIKTYSSGAINGLLATKNALYVALETEIARYYPLDNSPSFSDTFASWWIQAQLQQTGGGTGATDYTPQTAISEGATHLQTITAIDHDPLASVTIDVDVIGTGDWTLTVHNVVNDTIGTKTITNGSMSTGDVTFTFASVLRVKPDEEYHFHVTTTVADGGVDTDTNNDLEGAEYTLQFNPLIDSNFHPMTEFLLGFVVGNDNYLGFFDGATYNPTKLEFESGYEVRNITKKNEFVVVDCWRAPQAQQFDKTEGGKRYYWDGLSPTYNFSQELKVVAHATTLYKGELVSIAGNRGSLYRGDNLEQEIIDETPKLARGKVLEVFRGLDIYDERVVMGLSYLTDDGTSLEQGVYEFGSQASQLEEVLNFPYTISTGTTQSTSLKIALVKGYGIDLYIGWRDGSVYGVDKVTAGDGAAAASVFEDRIFDAGDPDHYMQAIKVEITFESLTTGQSVTPKYKLDRSASFTNGQAVTTVGETRAVVYINTLCKEIQWGFDLASSQNTFIKVTSVKFVYNPLEKEAVSA